MAKREPGLDVRIACYVVACCAAWVALRYKPVQIVTGPAAPKALDTQRHEELLRSQARLQRDLDHASRLVRDLGYRLAPADLTQSDLDEIEWRLRALEDPKRPPMMP